MFVIKWFKRLGFEVEYTSDYSVAEMVPRDPEMIGYNYRITLQMGETKWKYCVTEDWYFGTGWDIRKIS